MKPSEKNRRARQLIDHLQEEAETFPFDDMSASERAAVFQYLFVYASGQAGSSMKNFSPLDPNNLRRAYLEGQASTSRKG